MPTPSASTTPLTRLRAFDCALALPPATLNAAIASVLSNQGTHFDWTADIDVDLGISLEVACGPPRVALGETLDHVRIAFPIIDGIWRDGQKWSARKQAYIDVMEDLKGRELSFAVAFSQMESACSAKNAFSAGHLLADLTAIRAVDTTAHSINPGDPALLSIVTGFVRRMQMCPELANGALLQLSAAPKQGLIAESASPFEATAWTYSICGPQCAERDELLLLVMCGGRPLPSERTARLQWGPWTGANAPATLVLSARRILEAMVLPALVRLMSIHEGQGSVELIEGTDSEHARLVCSRTMVDVTDSQALFYVHTTSRSMVSARLEDGCLIVSETVTLEVNCHGELGEYEVQQQLDAVTAFSAELVNGCIQLTLATHQEATGGVRTSKSSGLLSVVGTAAQLLDAMPKNLLGGQKGLTSALGVPRWPLYVVSLPGSDTFVPSGLRGVGDVLLVDLAIG